MVMDACKKEAKKGRLSLVRTAKLKKRMYDEYILFCYYPPGVLKTFLPFMNLRRKIVLLRISNPTSLNFFCRSDSNSGDYLK